MHKTASAKHERRRDMAEQVQRVLALVLSIDKYTDPSDHNTTSTFSGGVIKTRLRNSNKTITFLSNKLAF